jgi:catechol 2,3-dioxygenase-like lactoylglutathione lyase family enzyme
MDIRFHSTVLITQRMDEMQRFYCGLLGQRVRFDFGNCITLECALTLWQPQEDYVISRALGADRLNAGNGSMEICFEIDDNLTAEADRIKAGGATLLHDIEEETWGQRTVRFYDPDGNIVELGESIPCFCRRLYNSGMSAAEVSQKTGVQTALVETYIKTGR